MPKKKKPVQRNPPTEALTQSGLGLENSPLTLYASYVFSLVVFFVLCSLVVAPITLIGGAFSERK